MPPRPIASAAPGVGGGMTAPPRRDDKKPGTTTAPATSDRDRGRRKKGKKGAVDQEEIVSGDVEWAWIDRHRTHWPFLRDRRVDAYAGLERRMLD